MSLSSKRIVLVDPLGEVLFSGASLIATDHGERERAEREARDACPETQRSATDVSEGSGVYRAVGRVSVSVEGEDADAGVETEIPTVRKKTA